MTGLWLEHLFWDEKAIQTLSKRMPTRHKATRGPWNGCTWGNPYHKLDWQGGLRSFPSTRVSEKLRGNHSASGAGTGNCLDMRVSNCSGIKRIRTWNTNIAGMKGEEIWQQTHHHWDIEAESGVTHCKWVWGGHVLLMEGNHSHPPGSQRTSCAHTRGQESRQNSVEHESGKAI